MGVEVLWKEKLRTASFEIAALAADLQDDKNYMSIGNTFHLGVGRRGGGLPPTFLG